jgi:predicted transcriptional regulator
LDIAALGLPNISEEIEQILRKRLRTEIIMNVLEASSSGIKKTRLMYATNLSYQLLVKYTKMLVDAGFLIYEGDLYYLTEKGSRLLTKLKHYGELRSMVSQIRSELDKEYESVLSLKSK